MLEYETVRPATQEQVRDIFATMMGAIPRGLSFEAAQAIIGGKRTFGDAIRNAFFEQGQGGSVLPADNEWFDLVVKPINPLEIVTLAGGYDASSWKYMGPPAPLVAERISVVLITIDMGDDILIDLEDAKKRARKRQLRLVGGHVVQSFMDQFPRVAGEIAFGGARWKHSSGFQDIVILREEFGDWQPKLVLPTSGFSNKVRWLATGER